MPEFGGGSPGVLRWSSVSMEVTQALFAHPDRPVEVVLQHAMWAAEGDLALLGRLTDAEHITVEAAFGALAESLAGGRVPLAESVAAPIFTTGQPVLVEHYPTGSRPVAPAAVAIGSVIVVALAAGGRIEGALTVGRLAGRPPFTPGDLDQLAAFAGQAGIALELDRSRTEREELRLLQDHDRIAMNLHDHVIQDLFATVMGLESMVGSLDRPDHRERILGHVADLDATIQRIRAAIFQLRSTESRPTVLHRRVMQLLEDELPSLGITPEIDLIGLDDQRIDDELAADVTTVVRKGLTSLAWHARATNASIRIELGERSLTVEIADDGHGPRDLVRSGVVQELRRLAAQRDGTLELSTPARGGGRLCWTAIVR